MGNEHYQEQSPDDSSGSANIEKAEEAAFDGNQLETPELRSIQFPARRRIVGPKLRDQIVVSDNLAQLECILDPQVQAVICHLDQNEEDQRLSQVLDDFLKNTQKEIRFVEIADSPQKMLNPLMNVLEDLELDRGLRLWLFRGIMEMSAILSDLCPDSKQRVQVCHGPCVPRFHTDGSNSKNREGVRLLRVFSGPPTQYVTPDNVVSGGLVRELGKSDSKLKLADVFRDPSDIRNCPEDSITAIRTMPFFSGRKSWVHRSPPSSLDRLVVTVSALVPEQYDN